LAGLADERITTSIEEILRLNAAAVGIPSSWEQLRARIVMSLATLVNQCENYGIPVMAITA